MIVDFSLPRAASESVAALKELSTELEPFRRSPRAETESPSINAMVACIHQQVFDPRFDVGALRRYCRIRDNNSSSRFRQLLGVTPRVYIECLRLTAAAELLRRHPGIPALDIGLLVGYEHPQTFYRAFRRHYGFPPGEARKRLENARPKG